MSRFYAYFSIQIKRVLKLLPALMLLFLIICVCTGSLALLSLKNGKEGEKQKKFQIGIVGNISDSYLNFGIYALQSMDDSRFMIDFYNMTEEEARAMLRQGKLTAYARIPDGLVDSLVSGANDQPVTYVAAEGQKGISNILMEEMVDVASVLVTRSQSAIYGMQRILQNHDENDIYWEATEQLNIRFIEQVLNRMDFCEVEFLGMANGLSTEGYYFCSILLVILLFSGINNSPLFTHKSRKLSQIMASKGVGPFGQVLGEYLAYFCLTFVCLLEMLLLLSIILEGDYLQIPEWKTKGAEPLVGFFIKIIPMAAMLTALQFLLYESVTGIVSSILLQFICGISMGYVSGYFYPTSFFPDTIQEIGKFLPTGVALCYTNESLTGNASCIQVLWVLLYLAIFLWLSVLVRKYKIQRG